jgi:nucleotide-binding universal stress UspA family protein
MATTLTHATLSQQQEGLAFQKLLVAYDFSPCAEVALEYAFDLAARQHAEITLLNIEPPASAVRTDLSVDELRARYGKQDITMSILQQTGSVGEVLSRTVAELHPDVLFLGGYGNDRQDRKVLGSTAELILRTLPCPVVLIGPKAARQRPAATEPEKIICPIDFPDDVGDRLAIIARFAKALQADVQLVHAVDIQHELSRPHSATDTQFEFDLLVGQLLHSGIAAQSTLLYGTPEEVISERAAETKAHYIMFGMHKDGNFSSFYRKSLVARVIKIAPCAVLAFPQIPREAI